MHRTAEDIKAIRETKKLSIKQMALSGYTESVPFELVIKVHDLNQAQIAAIDLPLSDEDIAIKFHLITDQVKTIQDLADIYGLEVSL